MKQRPSTGAGRLVPAAVGFLAVLLAGCASGRYSEETCCQERQRSKQIARSSFCERAAAPTGLARAPHRFVTMSVSGPRQAGMEGSA